MMTAVCVQGNGNAVHTNSADSLSNENDVDADEIYVVIKFCFWKCAETFLSVNVYLPKCRTYHLSSGKCQCLPVYNVAQRLEYLTWSQFHLIEMPEITVFNHIASGFQNSRLHCW